MRFLPPRWINPHGWGRPEPPPRWYERTEVVVPLLVGVLWVLGFAIYVLNHWYGR
jgi:hypothetical protein